jgi:sigma-B regulation protein RsbU (phosphoserine phosphatase)
MRGYRRRSTAAYLIGVAATFLLLTQLGGTLLALPSRPWWGLLPGPDDSVRRVLPGSPAEKAGIVKGDRVVRFGGVPWARHWEYRADRDGSLLVDLRATDGAVRTVRLEPASTPRAELVRQLAKAVIAGLFLVTGLVVFLSRSDRVATLFFLMNLLFSRLMFPEAGLKTHEAFLFDKLTLDLASLVLPAVVLHFFLSFPRRARFLAPSARRAWLLYLPAILGMPFCVMFDIDLVLLSRPVSRAALIFQMVTALIFVAMILWGLVSFVRGVRSLSSPVLRRSVRWLLPATAVGILPPLVLSGVLAVRSEIELPGDRYAFASLALVPLGFGHAILRYGLMDLELVVRRSVVYGALTALLVAAYYLVADVLGHVVGASASGRTLLSFAVVFAAALLFLPVRDRVQTLVDRALYRRRYAYRRTLHEFSRLLATFLERDELVRVLVERLPDVLGVRRAALFLRSPREDALHVAGTRGLGQAEIPFPVFEPSPALLAWWAEVDGPVPLGPAPDAARFGRLPLEERALLAALDARVVVFLPRERTLEGILVLGAKGEDESWGGEDLELLATIGDQAGTALSSARLHEEALARRRLEEELAVAKRIQASLLPRSVPKRSGVEIAAITRPCREVGGDLYDFLDFGPDALGLAVADVSGKGVPAALILSGLQATLRAEAGRDTAPEPVIRRVNERLCRDLYPGSFASVLYGHLDVPRRTFRYVNAGHPAGLIVRPDGTLDHLDEGGLLLGVEASATYRSGSRTFTPGDVLLLYSDGVTDVLNDADEEFGRARLEALVRRVAHLPCHSLLESITTAVETFVGGVLPDDLTLLVAKFPAEPEPTPPAA